MGIPHIKFLFLRYLESFLSIFWRTQQMYKTTFNIFPALCYWQINGKPVSSEEAQYGLNPNAEFFIRQDGKVRQDHHYLKSRFQESYYSSLISTLSFRRKDRSLENDQ